MNISNDGRLVLFLLLLIGSCLAALATDSSRNNILSAVPQNESGTWPRLLSETGAFTNLARLETAGGLIPYDLNVPFWSDGAAKRRWMVRADEEISFTSTGAWQFPRGTVFVKHFDLATDEREPQTKRRLETRFLVVGETGRVFGATYKWRADQSDAEVLQSNLTEVIAVRTASGTRTQNWYFPSRTDCVTCHTPNAGGVLGVNTRQLNRDLDYAELRENQLNHWNKLKLFTRELADAEIKSAPKLARVDDNNASVEERARSWLDANCSHCHRPGGTVAAFDTRYETPLSAQGLINAPVLIDEGIDGARVIAPNDIWRSILFMRVNTTEPFKMPPLAHEQIDREGVALLKNWIESLPGPPVLAPAMIEPRGGEFRKRVLVKLAHPDPQATLRYTLDGSVPGKSAAIYAKEIELVESTTLRVKAFKEGFTKSITTQETFVITD